MRVFKSHLPPILASLCLISSYCAQHVHRLQPRMFANSAAHGAQGFKASESAATGAKASNALSDGLELVGKGGAGGSEGFRAPSVGAAGGGAKDIHSPQILPQSDAKLAPLPKDRTLVDPKDAPTDPGLNLNPSSSNAPKENFQPPKRTTPLAPKEEFNTQAPTPKELPKENPPPTPEITPAPVEPPGEARALDTTPKLGDPNGALAPGAKPPPRKLLSLFDESSRTWGRPAASSNKFQRAWENTKSIVNSYRQKTVQNILKFVEDFKKKWNDNVPAAAARLKAKLRPAFVRQSPPVPKGEFQPQAPPSRQLLRSNSLPTPPKSEFHPEVPPPRQPVKQNSLLSPKTNQEESHIPVPTPEELSRTLGRSPASLNKAQRAWEKAKTIVNSYRQKTAQNILKFVEDFKKKWNDNVPAAVAKLKAKFRPAPGRESPPVPEAELPPQAPPSRQLLRQNSLPTPPKSEFHPEVPPSRQLLRQKSLPAPKTSLEDHLASITPKERPPIEYELFDIEVSAGRRPPREAELPEFNRRKMEMLKGIANREDGLELGNGKDFTIENLAKFLDEKIPAPGKVVTIKNGKEVVASQPYLEYLTTLNQYKKTEETLKKAQTAITGLETITKDIAPVTKEAKVASQTEVVTLLTNLKRGKILKYNKEAKIASNSLGKFEGELSHEPQSYFPNMPVGKDAPYLRMKAIDTPTFSEARAYQLTQRTPEELAKTTFSTVEEVIHVLPADLDLTQQLYRYSMIKGFEGALADVRSNLKPLLEEEAQAQIKAIFDNPSHLMPQIESYINKLGEADFARLYGERPLIMYEKLGQTPLPAEKISYAVNSRKALLKDEDFTALLGANANRRVFKRQFADVMKRASNSEDPNKAQYIEMLTNLQKDAVNIRSDNFPYVEELFNRGIIDEATRAKLNPPNGITQAEYSQNLGKQEDFANLLVSKFHENLLAQAKTPSAVNADGLDLGEEASYLLSTSYAEEMEKKVKPLYLTKDAFENRKPMTFDEAIKVYNPTAIRASASMDNPDTVAKAFIDAHFPRLLQKDLQKFLSEIHMPPTLDKDPIFELFPEVDKRLAAFARNPLVENDARLKGTPWEKLSADSRKQLNKVADIIFSRQSNLELIDASAAHAGLVKAVKTMEAQLNEEIPEMLEVFRQIKQYRKLLKKPEVTMTQSEIEKVNEAYETRLAAARRREFKENIQNKFHDAIYYMRTRPTQFVKGWYERIKEAMSKFKSHLPARFRPEGQIVPAEAHIVPADGQIAPAGGQIVPADGQIAPAGGQIVPAKVQTAPPEIRGNNNAFQARFADALRGPRKVAKIKNALSLSGT
ncbi:hypothetical protein Pst134EA_028018 [Puccinia striiformis f. sp. tritici]|uniref:hypothetical protein n=1 Tax=Puccinia striiformis f. sp. tritici TaxID=168172 RepID=UPI00200819D3|nr:hypothetical protein Pst134EA_028018 [Puccinia striiformis f. sp. tritici]KAH9448726.1 hypothetical protein Pst134EA_028018 [Puccinia striiformis f. sp. tritici]